MRAKVGLSLPLLLFGSMTVFAQGKPGLGGPRLKVQIISDKPVYKVGEPILITITLRNDGNEVVWMSKPRGVGIDDGEFYIEAVAPDGRLVPNMSPVSALTPTGRARSKTKNMQHFLCERVPLYPGDFWGVSRSLDDAFVSLKAPGRYRVTARYNEHEIEGLSKDELRDLQREVRFPIQIESVVSEPLILELR